MNIIFIEPSFPYNQREFVRGLFESGANVIGIGERPQEYLSDDVKSWLSHYVQVQSVVHEPSLLKAVQHVQGLVYVDRLETTIEAHIMAAAKVREATGIPGTSVRTAYLCRDKPAMKDVLREAGIACAKLYISMGVKHENLLMVDSKGVMYEGRGDTFNKYKAEFVRKTDCRTLEDAMVDADCFVGVSIKDLVTKKMVKSMAKDPLIFAMANPDPEITYPDAIDARKDVIMATGRSDYPNQVNNVLGFPFIFRGALDVRSTGISEGMKIAAARSLAELARLPVPDTVLTTYGLDRLSLGPEYLIPKPFDPRVLWHVAPAVAAAATAEGVARCPLRDVEEYRDGLQSRFQATYGLLHPVTVKARANPLRVAFPHAADIRVVPPGSSKENHFSLIRKNRADNCHIGKMRATPVGIIGKIKIPLLHRVPPVINHRPHSICH